MSLRCGGGSPSVCVARMPDGRAEPRRKEGDPWWIIAKFLSA